MKISPSIVRRLRVQRGWSQDQLAVASGLSLRTIQRVEAEGIAAMGTVVSLAATFDTRVVDLQERESVTPERKTPSNYNALFLGLAVITVAALSESGRLPALDPRSNAFAAINLVACIVGVLLAAPPLVRLFKHKQFIATVLALIGAPLVTLLAAGAVFAFASGRLPTWQLASLGAGGAVLVVLAMRELRTGS